MKRIAVISINRDKYSETFIRNHVKRLPAEVHFLTGGYLPVEVSIGISGEVRPIRAQKSAWWKKTPPAEEDKTALRTAVADYLKQQQIEAVLAEYGPSGVEMMAPCREAGVPLIVHFHGYDAYRQDMLAAFGDQYQALFGQAAAIIAVSRHMQEHLIDLGAPAEKVHWTPCGPDESLFQPASHDQRIPGRFLAAGRFAETKSPHLSLLAFSQVCADFPKAQLVFCGEGHLKVATEILAKALGIADRVQFNGKVSQAELSAEMGEAIAFVQHSVTTPENDREGTPVAIQEAGLAGLPVISTRHGGIPDVIREEETGILVDEMDVGGMAEAMKRLLLDPALARRMGDAAHQHIRTHFSLQKHIDQLWEILLSTGKSRK